MLAGITADTRISLGDWLDAVYASLVTAPTDVLVKLEDSLVVNAALADPEGARETWGLLPEHRIHTPLEHMQAE